MTNTEIIYCNLKARGMTDAQLQTIMDRCNGDLPFHTVPEWSRRGYHVKAGEEALFECNLWKHTNKPSAATIKAAEDAGDEAPELSPHFYKKLCRVYGFHQVEKNAPAPDLATIKARLGNLPGLTLTVKGEKSGAPNVWLTGDTTAHAETIKALGGIWSNKKGAYWIKPSAAQDAPAAVELPAAPAALALPAHVEEPAPAPVPDAAPAISAPQPWKKCKFYTIRRDKDGKPAPLPAEGYTDGLFNYYSQQFKDGKMWHAVHPVYGLSVAYRESRKAAQEAALEVLPKVREMESKPDARLAQYAAAIKAAQDGDNTSLF